MSESSVPFDSATAPSPEPVMETTSSSSDRSRLFLFGGIAGVVLVGILAYFLFFAGGGDDTATDTPATPVAPAAPNDAAEAPAAAPQQRLNAKSFGRDPFKALIVETAVVEAPVAETPVAVTPVTSGGTTTDTTSGSSGTSGTTDGTSSPAATSPHSFRVLSVAPDNSTITVKVDGKRYDNLRAGEVFASFFKVRLIGGAVNSFQYGEERFNVLGNKRLTIA
jgi:hypothetical protein